MKKFLSMLVMLSIAGLLFAIPAQPGLWKKMQLANGQTIDVQLRGDEFMKFWQDKAGNNYTLSDKGLVKADMKFLHNHTALGFALPFSHRSIQCDDRKHR